jgi:hypothetical protein
MENSNSIFLTSVVVPSYVHKAFNEFLKFRLTSRLVTSRELVTFFLTSLFPNLDGIHSYCITFFGLHTIHILFTYYSYTIYFLWIAYYSHTIHILFTCYLHTNS